MAHHHHHHEPGSVDPDPAALIELLDLDAEVLHAYWSEVSSWVQSLAADRPVRRILDLGSGTGSGCLALAERFPAADLTAVDVAPPMLDRLRDKARARGLADRIHTVLADLDDTWPTLDPVDLAWASNSLHHLADPDRALAALLAAIHPGGWLVVAELESFPRFLPDDLGRGRPGLESRVHATLAEQAADALPHLGSDWGVRLSKAGFTLDAQRTFAIALTPPLPAATVRYAELSLDRVRTGLGDRLSAEDRATLDALLDDHGPDRLRQRTDLTVRATRTVWIARRP